MAKDLLRQERLQEMARTTEDLKYSEVDSQRPRETKQTTGDSRDN